jgi:hypothetical protein
MRSICQSVSTNQLTLSTGMHDAERVSFTDTEKGCKIRG